MQHRVNGTIFSGHGLPNYERKVKMLLRCEDKSQLITKLVSFGTEFDTISGLDDYTIEVWHILQHFITLG